MALPEGERERIDAEWTARVVAMLGDVADVEVVHTEAGIVSIALVKVDGTRCGRDELRTVHRHLATDASALLRPPSPPSADASAVEASVADASNAIHFAIESGPGRVSGVHNGDAKSHEPQVASARRAYHGLARASVKVTRDAMSDARPPRAPREDARAATPEHVVVDGAQCEAVIARLAHEPSLGHAYVVSHAKSRAAFFAREARAMDAHASGTCARMASDATSAMETIGAVARVDFDGVMEKMDRCAAALEALAKPS